jgi:hypothetical protein
MPQSLLDECYHSILEIAETQSPGGKSAMLALAVVFRDNSGRRFHDGQLSNIPSSEHPCVRSAADTF